MKGRFLLLFICLLFTLPVVSNSFTMNQVDIDVKTISSQLDLELEEASSFETEITFSLTSDTDLSLELYIVLFNVTVMIDNQQAATRVEENNGITTIEITPSTELSLDTEHTLHLNAKFNAMYEQVDQNRYQIFYNWDSNWKSNNISITMILPPYAIIQTDENENVMFPSNASFNSNGQEIIIIWTGLSNDGDLNTRLFVQFETNELLSGSEPSDQNGSSLLTWVLLTLLLISIGIIIYLVKFREAEIQTEEKVETKIITNIKPVILSPQDLEVLKVIAQYDGGILQSELVDALNYSRARVSQYLSDFEEKGLIKKHKMGRQNYIVLDSNVKLDE